MLGSTIFFLGAVPVLALAVTAYLVLNADESPFHLFLGKYEAHLQRHTRFLLSDYDGSQIARLQVMLVATLIGLALVFQSLPMGLVAVIVAVAPPLVLQKQHDERVVLLERQLDTWLMMLANALKATSSIGDAISSTINLVQKPFSEEIDLLIKENQLGTPIDRAVKNMDTRINSAVVSGALSMIVVARETGGNLPEILETSAGALREAARLDGVLRAKIAEGRGQLIVIAVMPFVLCGIIGLMDPEWFAPMYTTSQGRMLLGAAIVGWGLALFWANNIIDIDV